jgi:hypothetical protein
MAKKTVKDLRDLKGTHVFVRVDYNCPLEEGGITDDTRIRASLPTLEYLVKAGARLALASHLGRPKKGPTPEFSLAPVAARLGELLRREVRMLQAGILPTFYQFTESIIEVKMSISSKTESESEFEFGASAEVSAGFLFASGTFSSHVNYKTTNKYSYSVEGSSLLRTTLKPSPPPTRMMPRFILVNALVNPPTVTTSE